MLKDKICPKCLNTMFFTSTNNTWSCPSCRFAKREVKKGMPDNTKRSRKQEKRLAKERGGRVQAASGATPFMKGDVEDERFLYECKTTTKKGYRITKSELEKIHGEAAELRKIPVLQIEFDDGQTSGRTRYAVLQWHDFSELTSELPRTED